MVTAMVSAVVGLLMVWSNLYMPLSILGPVGMKSYMVCILYGIICMYIIRKPGFAFRWSYCGNY